ncbi:MAG: ferritin-like domain-containing protein [Ferruginibacter sp.]|nr:ferritin-like domain-containing protein [Cytophagales bacterium]
MKLESLRDLFEESIQDLYSAETQIIDAMPKIVARVTDSRLKQALESHVLETQAQKERLEEICEKLDIDPDGKFCRATEGLVKEANELLSEDAAPAVLDAGIIASVQKIEHYEIAGYGTARVFAMHLGETEVQKLLEESLQEEKQADVKLTVIAEGTVNEKAEGAS